MGSPPGEELGAGGRPGSPACRGKNDKLLRSQNLSFLIFKGTHRSKVCKESSCKD